LYTFGRLPLVSLLTNFLVLPAQSGVQGFLDLNEAQLIALTSCVIVPPSVLFVVFLPHYISQQKRPTSPLAEGWTLDQLLTIGQGGQSNHLSSCLFTVQA
jgi:hypothetical protein